MSGHGVHCHAHALESYPSLYLVPALQSSVFPVSRRLTLLFVPQVSEEWRERTRSAVLCTRPEIVSGKGLDAHLGSLARSAGQAFAESESCAKRKTSLSSAELFR